MKLDGRAGELVGGEMVGWEGRGIGGAGIGGEEGGVGCALYGR
jgi:hypothetical protein